MTANGGEDRPSSGLPRKDPGAGIYLVQHPDGDSIPKIIGMARQAMQHDENPLLLQQHMKQIHRAGTP